MDMFGPAILSFISSLCRKLKCTSIIEKGPHASFIERCFQCIQSLEVPLYIPDAVPSTVM